MSLHIRFELSMFCWRTMPPFLALHYAADRLTPWNFFGCLEQRATTAGTGESNEERKNCEPGVTGDYLTSRWPRIKRPAFASTSSMMNHPTNCPFFVAFQTRCLLRALDGVLSHGMDGRHREDGGRQGEITNSVHTP